MPRHALLSGPAQVSIQRSNTAAISLIVPPGAYLGLEARVANLVAGNHPVRVADAIAT